MKRKIIQIDAEKCTGCGLCMPNCPEGAIQIIDGKARLVNDRFCDGLGACLGHCPEGAITIAEREAEPYDERKVMNQIQPQGMPVVRAHLAHLRDHNQLEDLALAIEYLREQGIKDPLAEPAAAHAEAHSGCPGRQIKTFAPKAGAPAAAAGDVASQLTHWPVQLHLLSPAAPAYQNADLLLAADCTAYAMGDFHARALKGKALAIACPKLDSNQEVYVQKLTALIDEAHINTLTVLIMEVPCCRGLLAVAQRAANAAKRRVPVKCAVVGIQGNIKSEEWV